MTQHYTPTPDDDATIREELEAIGAEVDCWPESNQTTDDYAAQILACIDEMFIEIDAERDRLSNLRDEVLTVFV